VRHRVPCNCCACIKFQWHSSSAAAPVFTTISGCAGPVARQQIRAERGRPARIALPTGTPKPGTCKILNNTECALLPATLPPQPGTRSAGPDDYVQKLVTTALWLCDRSATLRLCDRAA
jgi:hypothetical protein